MTGDDTVRLTYAELARCRGVSIGAAKRLAQRHRWARQIGNDGLSRVSVPATFVAMRESVADDTTADVAAHTAVVADDVVADVAEDVTADVAGHIRNSGGIRLDEVVAAFTTVVRDMTTDTYRAIAGDVISTLRDQVQIERDRADRAEMQLGAERDRADRAEGRIRELSELREAELLEHRRVVGLLAEQLAVRRSWWRWRR